MVYSFLNNTTCLYKPIKNQRQFWHFAWLYDHKILVKGGCPRLEVEYIWNIVLNLEFDKIMLKMFCKSIPTSLEKTSEKIILQDSIKDLWYDLQP